MKYFLKAAGLLLSDLASTIVFLIMILATGSVVLAIAAGMLLAVAQIGYGLAIRRPIGLMQWLSAGLVMGFGAVSLITHDPRFIMVKPTLIYVIVGAVMLKPRWMNRYFPPEAQVLLDDVGLVCGYLWAALMFASAGLNFVLALSLKPVVWAQTMAVYGIASKAAMFLAQYAVMRVIARRRAKAGWLTRDKPDAAPSAAA